MGELVDGHGGDPLRGPVLTASMFAANAMETSGDLPFEEMKIEQLKEELAARCSTRTGLKAVLHSTAAAPAHSAAAMVQAEIERRARGEDVIV